MRSSTLPAAAVAALLLVSPAFAATFTVDTTTDDPAKTTCDAHAADDDCPRQVTPPGVHDPFPDGKLVDKGCGRKKADKTFGDPVTVDVIDKRAQ